MESEDILQMLLVEGNPAVLTVIAHLDENEIASLTHDSHLT